MTTTNDVVAHGCGCCLALREAHHEPDACFGCGTRFDRGAPLVVVHIDVDVDGLSIVVAPRLTWHGRWTRDSQLAIESAVAQMFDAQEAS